MPDQDAPNATPGRPNPQLTRFILWAALLLSIGMYGVIGTIVPSMTPRTPDASLPMLTQVLICLAIVESGAILALPRLLPAMAVMQRDIIRWALTESIAIFGLVLAMLGAQRTVLYGLAGWAAVLMLLLMPRGQGADQGQPQ